MKLALIRQRYNPHGGAERFVARALEALGRAEMPVTLIARDWPEGTRGELLRCDPFYAGRLWRDWSFARAACRAACSGGFDLVQAHERVACCDIYRAGDGVHAAWLERRSRVLGPFARALMRCNPYHLYTLAAERALFASPKLRAVICNSQMVAGEIAQRFAVAPERLHVIRNGVDLERFHPRARGEHRAPMRERLGIGADATVFLHVGGGFERKGVPQLLSAFARSGRSDARLLVVGADRAERALRARAAALGVETRVIFAGAQDDVLRWYGAADCFALPTLYDPFPNAALEAMACALPVITSRDCGAAELIEPGRQGYVCDALDIDSLAGHLRVLTPARCAAMGEAAREAALALGIDAMTARLVALYRSLAQRR